MFARMPEGGGGGRIIPAGVEVLGGSTLVTGDGDGLGLAGEGGRGAGAAEYGAGGRNGWDAAADCGGAVTDSERRGRTMHGSSGRGAAWDASHGMPPLLLGPSTWGTGAHHPRLDKNCP